MTYCRIAVCLAPWSDHEENPYFLRVMAGNMEKKGINISCVFWRKEMVQKKGKSLQDKSYKLC